MIIICYCARMTKSDREIILTRVASRLWDQQRWGALRDQQAFMMHEGEDFGEGREGFWENICD